MKEELTSIDKKLEEFNKRFGSFEVFYDESKKQYIYPQSEMVSFLRQALLDIQKETAREILRDAVAWSLLDTKANNTNVNLSYLILKYDEITGEDYDMLY